MYDGHGVTKAFTQRLKKKNGRPATVQIERHNRITAYWRRLAQPDGTVERALVAAESLKPYRARARSWVVRAIRDDNYQSQTFGFHAYDLDGRELVKHSETLKRFEQIKVTHLAHPSFRDFPPRPYDYNSDYD